MKFDYDKFMTRRKFSWVDYTPDSSTSSKKLPAIPWGNHVWYPDLETSIHADLSVEPCELPMVKAF